MSPISLCFCRWSVHFKVVRRGKNAHSNQRKATTTKKTAVSRQVYVDALLIQRL